MPAIVANTFSLVITTISIIHTIDQSAPSLLSCAASCLKYGTCGGIVWPGDGSNACQFVVDSSTTGALLSSATKAYRIDQVRGNLTLSSFPSTVPKIWSEFEKRCLDIGQRLVPHPTSMKDRAVLSIRTGLYVFVDLQRRVSDSVYVESSGVEADMSLVSWSGSNPHGGSQLCIGYGYIENLYYDLVCDIAEESTTELFCVSP